MFKIDTSIGSVAVTEDHSLIVYDANLGRVVEKSPLELRYSIASGRFYILAPNCLNFRGYTCSFDIVKVLQNENLLATTNGGRQRTILKGDGYDRSLPKKIELTTALACTKQLASSDVLFISAAGNLKVNIVKEDYCHEYVYDLSVEGNENFLAGHGAGIFVHNTGTPSVQRTIHDKTVNEMGTKAVLAIDPNFNGIACVPPNTYIISHRGGKLIKDLTANDAVLSANGKSTKANRVLLRNYSGPIFTVRAKGLIPFRVTPEHPILTVGRFRRYFRKAGKLHYDWQITEKLWKTPAEFVPAKGWHGVSNPHDCLLLPKMKPITRDEDKIDLTEYVKRTKQFYTHYFDSLKISSELFKFFGLYLAEGHSEGTSINLDFGKHEKGLIEETKQIVKDAFGISPKVKLTGTTARIYFCSKILLRFLRDKFGVHAEDKKIPEIVIKAPINLVKTFLEYYLKGDGFIQTKKNYLLLRYGTASEVLALQLQLLFTRLNRFAKIYCHRTLESKINGRQIPGSLLYEVRLLGSKDDIFNKPLIREEYSEDDEYFYIPIVSVTRDNYSGLVYNLETENETYLVSNAVVHNCVDLKENKEGVPCVTEINAGRMFTTSFFFSYASKILRKDYYANIPYLYVRLAYKEKIPDIPKYDILPENVYWIRHIDAPAKLVKNNRIIGAMYG
jgi:intein/homing endonuclease